MDNGYGYVGCRKNTDQKGLMPFIVCFPHLGHGALKCEVEHGQDVMIQHTAAAALAVDGELLQESHTGLHCLGAAEQGPDKTAA